ncbi:MAG: HEAT repeat domain-containing protein [Planctomycetota bacterium]|jgi:HEAT repeat protein
MMTEPTYGSFFRVIEMVPGRLLFVVLLLSVCCWQAGICQEEAVEPDGGPAVPAQPNAQLQLYKEALVNKGSNEQMRINAANLLLFSEDPLAREILLAALKVSENSAARAAVCKALSKVRAEQKAVRRSEEFVPALLAILQTEREFAIAKLAAEAMLLFEYEQLSEKLEKIATDFSLPSQVRLNSVYALKLQPDKGAVFALMDLLDDPDEQVATASREALSYLRVPIGKDAETRKQIRSELERRKQDEFLRNRLIYQEAEMRELASELDWWKKQYLEALDTICDSITEDAAKGKFLARHLGGSEPVVKLWALDKVYEDRMATTPKLPVELLGPMLVDLISYEDKGVRLKTAQLLSLMGGLNSVEKLLEQVRIEQVDEVRTEVFVALGVAVSSALLSDSQSKMSPEIIDETLEWAVAFLSEADAEKSQRGAEVIKKLLERRELAPADVGIYLTLLAERYEQEQNDGALRGELLIRMAGLCAPGSACEVESAKLFRPLFERALSDKTDLVREAAVDGLIHISKTDALTTFRKADLINDPAIGIRNKVVILTGEIGGKEGLVALWQKVGSPAEGSAAWEAMLKIFRRCEADVLSEWMERFNEAQARARLSGDQELSFLTVAEQKAVGGKNRAQMLKVVRERLAELYRKGGKFEQAADYFGRLHDAAPTLQEKESILPDLLDAYLRWPNVERAARLVDNCLLRKDLGPESGVVISIDSYLGNPPAGLDPNEVVGELLSEVGIKAEGNRPQWQEQVRRWKQRIGQGEGSREPERG